MANPKPVPNKLAKSLEEMNIVRIVESGEGYAIERLEVNYGGDEVNWSWVEDAKTIEKARKHVYRLTKGQVF